MELRGMDRRKLKIENEKLKMKNKQKQKQIRGRYYYKNTSALMIKKLKAYLTLLQTAELEVMRCRKKNYNVFTNLNASARLEVLKQIFDFLETGELPKF